MSIYDDIFGGIDQALDIVDEAITTGNFKNMSSRIKDAVEPLDQTKSTGNRWRDADGKAGGRSYYNGGRMDNRGNAFQGTYQGGSRPYSRYGNNTNRSNNASNRSSYTRQRSSAPRTVGQKFTDPLTGETPFFKRVGSTLGSTFLFGSGLFMAGINGLFALLSVVGTVADYLGGVTVLTGGVLASTFFLSMTAVFAMVAHYGKKGREVAAHYKEYRKILSVNGYANVSDISKATGIPEAKVVKELKSMTRAGMFKQGHFDDKETCFIASDEMYNLYRQAEDNAKRLREEAEKERREQGYVSAELKEVLDKGNEYVRLIREVNADIPGEEVSGKLSKMETIVSKIFETVREHPEQADKLSMFMDYYLPTTAKLIIAYRDMDKKAVQGQNIESAKREIEDTLDMINEAFETLFDSMFKEQSLDVQTDIDVMRTMMKQQGLAPDELDLLRRKEVAQNARETGKDMWGNTYANASAGQKTKPKAAQQTTWQTEPQTSWQGEPQETWQTEPQTTWQGTSETTPQTSPYTEQAAKPQSAADKRKAEAEAVKAAEAKLKSGMGKTSAGAYEEQTSPILEWGGSAVMEEDE